MTIQESEEKYGSVQGYINNLKELYTLNDLRSEDITDTLIDINFIRVQGELKEINEIELIDLVQGVTF